MHTTGYSPASVTRSSQRAPSDATYSDTSDLATNLSEVTQGGAASRSARNRGLNGYFPTEQRTINQMSCLA